MKNIYKLQINMANIRFKNLPSLLNDMKKKKWIIDSFFFQYKDEKYIVNWSWKIWKTHCNPVE